MVEAIYFDRILSKKNEEKVAHVLSEEKKLLTAWTSNISTFKS